MHEPTHMHNVYIVARVAPFTPHTHTFCDLAGMTNADQQIDHRLQSAHQHAVGGYLQHQLHHW